jgi:hypothetical protein
VSPRTMRRAERLVHLAWGALVVLHAYALLPSWWTPVVRWVAVPGIVASGLAMWFAAPMRRLARRMRRVPPVAQPGA